MSDHVHSPFGSDRFGQTAERFARFFGTPNFIVGQTVLVVVWIALNAAAVGLRWDPYPFILLNLAFSTQAAYAAPLILLAQRQADRDKTTSDQVARMADTQRRHVEEQSGGIRELLQTNIELTQRIAMLTAEIHAAACEPPVPIASDDPRPPAHAGETASDALQAAPSTTPGLAPVGFTR